MDEVNFNSDNEDIKIKSKVCKNKSNSKQERVTITNDLLSKIDSWSLQIKDRFDGIISTSRSDIVNFLIDKHDVHLSESDFQKIQETHFDEVRLIQLALEKAKAAKQKGENVDLKAMLFPFMKPLEKQVKRKSKSSKLVELESSEEIIEPPGKPESDSKLNSLKT